jgi:hypothetical protein
LLLVGEKASLHRSDQTSHRGFNPVPPIMRHI